MCATTSCLTPQPSIFFGPSATPVPTLFFSTLMGDEAKSIARGLQRRDPDLLDRLIEQYQYRLFRYLVYITGNKERAEDFFQETWIRVLERGHQYNGKSKFEAWLFAIARNLVIDWQRSKKAQSLDTLTDPEQEHPLQLANENDPSPLRQVLSHETEETVQTSLQLQRCLNGFFRLVAKDLAQRRRIIFVRELQRMLLLGVRQRVQTLRFLGALPVDHQVSRNREKPGFEF